MDNNGATEKVFEGVDSSSQFQEEVGFSWDAVVWPADELDVSHLPLCALLSPLNTRAHKHVVETGTLTFFTTQKNMDSTHVHQAETADGVIGVVLL